MAGLTERPPSPWLQRLFRAPIPLFRHGLGWMFGGRLLLLIHTGRKTGRRRETVLEVVAHNRRPDTWYVVAAWGERSDWYQNVLASRTAEVMVGGSRHTVTAERIDEDRAAAIYADYVRRHRIAARLIGRFMGIDMVRTDPKELARRLPVIALVAADARRGESADDIARVATTRADTQATYDRIAPFYEAVEGVWERKARRVGFEALRPLPDETCLEVGSGPGHVLRDIAAAVGPGGLAVGVDLSPRMCALSRNRLAAAGLLGVGQVVRGDATHLPFPDAAFDGAFTSFTLELFDTPEIPVVLAELRRVLRPGGRLVVVSLSKEDRPPPMQRMYERGHDRFPRALDCRPIRVAESLEQAGYVVVDHRRLSLFGVPVAVVEGRAP